MEAGVLTRVINDFFTTVDGELSLHKGEYFLIHNVIDKHWCYGVSRNRSGRFPSNYLHKVEVPGVNESECIFVSSAPFRGEQQGDLIFGEGEIIVGTHEVEPGWYSGRIDDRIGVFPLTHVWLVDPTILKKPANKKTVRRKARVKTTLKAQLDEELDLTEGEIVTIIEILEDGWARGITSDNRTGTFPEAFVSYLEDETMESRDQAASSTTPDPIPQSALSGGTIFKDFGQLPNSNYSSYYEEPAPSYYDLFPDAQPKPPVAEAPSYSLEVTVPEDDTDNLNPLGVNPYAITLYPFNAQFPNELNFEAGEVVHLLRHIDSEWAEGTIDNEKGIFPTSYVNIIVDCVQNSTSEASSEIQEPVVTFDPLDPGDSATVEYTFNAQMSGDLSVAEGDSVTVVEMANEHWVSVKNKFGEVGLCPRGYLSKQTPSEVEFEQDHVDDFVVIRTSPKPSDNDQRSKRQSEPHRPAPPAPAPGSIPLQKQLAVEKSQTISEQSTGASEMNEVDSSKQKRADKRQNVISELVITEKEYVRDLKITYETFNLYDPSSLEVRGIDVTVLFGNILEVIHVAEELLDLILRAMKGCEEERQTVAPCFLKMADKLQSTYGKYCGNHEAALALLKKYEENREIMAVFDKGIETLRYQVACFDMSSILIKPVQRILKYPLMLHELSKCTEDDHPDKEGIEEAWKAMTNVASYINEYKRRKDIVSKYLDSDNTLMRKMAKLNMHSVAKKSSRLSAKLSASLGITNIPADPVFDELERQFKALEKCTWQLASDIEQCMHYLSEETLCAELLSDFLNQYHYGSSDNEVKRLNETRAIISSQFIRTLRETIEKRVNEPISSLITLLEGPAVLIGKRRDKLFDYDNAISKSEKNRDSRIAQEELAEAKNNYEALNQQLLEELPIVINAVTSVLATCIEGFANARKLFSGKITKKYLTLSESATQVTAQDILQSFLVTHNLLWNQISRFSFAGVNPNIEEAKVEVCTQGERDRRLLMNKYTRNNLFVVKENVISTSSLDLGATKGTIVAVIKRQDPMGDSTRWFVDNGSVKAFIASNTLEPIPQARTSVQNNNDVTDSAPTGNLMSLESPVKEVKTNLINLDSPVKEKTSNAELLKQLYSNVGNDNDNERFMNQEQRYQNFEDSFYYAEYNFESDMPGTLSAKCGRMLKLIKPFDQKGNSDWWLMEDRDGNTGYVPQTFLTPFSSNRH